jgi:hypothetical protein
MKASLLMGLFALIPPLLGAPSPLAAGEPTAPQPNSAPPSMPAQPEPMREWLEEVRAQRRAWEERRKAAKEAMDARRRWIDPWGAAQKEAREKENRRRREAFMEHIERERESFRGAAPPWGGVPDHWTETPRAETMTAPRDPPDDLKGPADPLAPAEPEPRYPPLPGWDNRWYYRGY